MSLFAVAPSSLDIVGPFGAGFLVFYVCSLLFIGWLGHRAKKESSLADFYLGGRGLGIFVLLLTLYATQYSGNTMLGFVGKAYRSGFYNLSGVVAMMAVIGGFVVFAPKLHRLSHRHGFITPGDFVQHRFGMRALTVAVALLGIFALGNYILTNLKVLGLLVENISGGTVSFAVAVVVLSVIMFAYEAMGGLRSVAWTDVIQGVILLVGILGVFVALQFHYGGLPGVSDQLEASRPEIWAAPTATEKVTWLSTLLIFFFGISMYPHAIQRIYAAKSGKVLRRSFQIMAFMPLFTTFLVVMLGIMGIAVFPGLDQEGAGSSDEVTLYMIADLIEKTPLLLPLGILFLGAIVAATMSTIDSALLAMSSMITKDIYFPIRPDSSDRHLTLIGKVVSAILMAGVAALTIALQDLTIWRLMEIKLEVLCQIAPAVMLGIHQPRLRADSVFAGLIVGTVMAVSLAFEAFELPSKPLGVHAGVWGLAANLAVMGIVQVLRPAGLKD
ncbi:MAG: sodium:solute symporter family protein [Verrucomicrobiota bacterium]